MASSSSSERLLHDEPPLPDEFRHPNGRAKVALAAYALGLVSGLALLLLALAPTRAAPFAAYLLLLTSFHMGEYLLTAAYRPDTLSFDNFLLNHSALYQLMTALSWLEYWLEATLPTPLAPLKRWSLVSWLGLATCFAGLGSRFLAMATATSNFSHMIEEEKREQHVLVTRGIYGWLRHPAYFGYFYWAVGTQVLLVNPVCLVAYALASFLFFVRRIHYEERILLRFFGEDYRRYRDHTRIGIPFIEWCLQRATSD